VWSNGGKGWKMGCLSNTGTVSYQPNLVLTTKTYEVIVVTTPDTC
jgi:hypothetical protein